MENCHRADIELAKRLWILEKQEITIPVFTLQNFKLNKLKDEAFLCLEECLLTFRKIFAAMEDRNPQISSFFRTMEEGRDVEIDKKITVWYLILNALCLGKVKDCCQNIAEKAKAKRKRMSEEMGFLVFF